MDRRDVLRYVCSMSQNPWAGLEPSDAGRSGSPEPLYPEVGTARVLLRGLAKRCPRCGIGGIFSSWFHLRGVCPRCSLRFEREAGGYLGAMTINYGVAIGIWILVLVIGLALTVPVVPVPQLMVASVVVLVAVPLLFYPNSKAIWAAIEFLVLRSDPDYRPPVRRDPRASGLE
jgi:uncharacterized protein (DUF983 family)